MRYEDIRFDQDGTLLTGDLQTGHAENLFVFSHGWNSSEDSARRLYSSLFGRMAPMLSGEAAFAGVLWPSLLFPEDEPAADGPVIGTATQSAPGILVSAAAGGTVTTALASAFPGQEDDLAEIGALLDSRPQDPDKLQRCHRLISGLVTSPPSAEEDAGEAAALDRPYQEVFGAMAALAPAGGSHAQGVDLFQTMWAGARETLRALSYYEMKNRAGVIGRRGLGPLLDRLIRRNPGLRVHLMGHSFGARLAAYALTGLPPGVQAGSLMLIQAAFSHFAFVAGRGALSGYGSRVAGPLVSTFSTADRALSWWYPMASRLARQDTSSEAAHRWGALGHDGFDGAASTPLAAAGRPYAFRPGGFHNLDANAVINRRLSFLAGAHSDIERDEVAWAAVAAAGLS
ncbi:hypothetical protein [Nonomuraea typhae]|uniref:Serine-threonine protein kinase n=1 Tax=Nonomuraea typhae TaxID=2603600 RepID=A0ABW7YSX2_9ACTN